MPGRKGVGISCCAQSRLDFLAVLVEALSDSLPVDNLPDGLEVVGADVLVLEVVGVLPDINAQQGDQTGGGLEGVLVGGGSDLKALEVLVVALLEKKKVFPTAMPPIFVSHLRPFDRPYFECHFNQIYRSPLTNQPQPDPWTAAVWALNFSMNLSKEPQVFSISLRSSPVGFWPPPLDLGAKFSQKMVWLMCPLC